MGFDPVSLGMMAVGTASGLLGTAVSASGAQQQGQAQSANALYQAQVARNNAIIAQQNETYATEQGESEVAAEGMKSKAAIGTLKATQGANGVDVNSGSDAAVTAGAKSLANVDTQTIMSNAARNAYGYEVAATSDTAQSELDTQEASQAQAAGNTASLGSFLSGISSVGSNWGKYQSLGTGASSVGGSGFNLGIFPSYTS